MLEVLLRLVFAFLASESAFGLVRLQRPGEEKRKATQDSYDEATH